MADTKLTIRSFEIAAERCEDITPLVYEKLFSRYPEMEPLFSSNKAARGEMLAKVIDAIFDFLGPRTYANYMVQCEVITHEGYGVPREIFATFFGMVAETVEELAGPDWTPCMAKSWADLLRELDRFVQNPDQTAPATSLSVA